MIWESNPQIGGFLSERYLLPCEMYWIGKSRGRLLGGPGLLPARERQHYRPATNRSRWKASRRHEFPGHVACKPCWAAASPQPMRSRRKGQVALISYALFATKVRQGSGTIGKTIRVDSVPYSIGRRSAT